MRILNNLSDFPVNARVCLYGAGHFGEAVLSLLRQERRDVEVLWFVDGFKKGELSGIGIKGPDALVEISGRVDLIVVASDAFRTQMEETLRDFGVVNYALLNPMFSSVAMAPSSGKDGEMSDGADTLYAFYDLSVSYPGYDIVNFLFVAETERIRRGCRSLHPVFVPRPADTLIGRRSADRKIPGFDEDFANWMMRHVMVPCCWLVSSCRQVTVCDSRRDAERIQQRIASAVFPAEYRVSRPAEGCTWPKVFAAAREARSLPALRASDMALDFVRSWIAAQGGGRKVVTITLRESDSAPERNSNIESWLRFAGDLDAAGFFPVFLRDTSKSLNGSPESFHGFVAFSAAVWNVELRMALYQLSYINMFVTNGPAAMCLFARDTRCLIFIPVGESDVVTREHWASIGVPVGTQYVNATRFQRSVWGTDDYETLKEEFAKLSREIEMAENCRNACPC